MPIVPDRLRTNSPAPALLLLTPAILPCAAAHADWPTTPDEVVTIGIAEGTFFGTRQSLASTEGNTWIAWQDSICPGFDGGFLRLNRITREGTLQAVGGTPLQDDDTCAFVTPPLLAPMGDSVAAARNLADLSAFPVNRYDMDARAQWTPGFATDDIRSTQALATLPSGDLVVASLNLNTIRLDRLDASGSPVWGEPTLYASPTGSNFAIRAIVPTASGSAIAGSDAGFYVVWDAPTSYTRQAFIQKFTGDGQPLWNEPVVPMQRAPLPGISRHTPPTLTPTTDGRLMYIWTQGFEAPDTPAPVRYQIINPDGSLTFAIEGARLTDSTERQFDPVVVRHEASGEIDIVFRAGLFDSQTVRAQRLTADGQRLWDDSGIDIATITPGSSFDAALLNDELHVVTAEPTGGGTSSIRAFQATDTQSIRGPWTLANTATADSVRLATDDLGIIVTWQAEGPLSADPLEATRMNPAGRLGAPPCNSADLAAPYYVLDLADVQAFVPAFLGDGPQADLADPSGVLDLADIQVFVDTFTAGCF